MITLLIVCAVILIVAITRCWIVIPAYMGRLIQDPILYKKRVRPLGPGFHLLWPWEIPVEDSDTDLVTLSHSFQITLEAGREKTDGKKEENKTESDEENTKGQGEPVPLDCDFTTFPSVKDLAQFRKFKKEERIKAITENLKSFLTNIQKDYKNRQEIMEKTAEITIRARNFIDNGFIAVNDEMPTPTKEQLDNAFSEKLKFTEHNKIIGGMNMRQYYGVSIPLFIIGDVEQPPKLQEAIIQKEIVRQQNIARTLEMDNVRERAMAMVTHSGGKLQYEKAVKIVLMQDGKNIKEEKKIFGFEPGTLNPIKEVLIHVFGKKQ